MKRCSASPSLSTRERHASGQGPAVDDREADCDEVHAHKLPRGDAFGRGQAVRQQEGEQRHAGVEDAGEPATASRFLLLFEGRAKHDACRAASDSAA